MAIIPGSTCVIKTSVKDMDITLIDNAIFSFSIGIDETPLVQKKYQADNSGAVKYLDGAFIVPCTQQDTLLFDGNKNILYEAQLNFKDKSVSKTIYTKIPIRKTVATEIITGNAPNINQDDNYYVMQTDTAQYLNVSTEQIKGYVDLAQTYSLNAEKSEQEALEHAKYAENNKQQTYEFLSQTKALAAETSKAKDSVEGQIATATNLSNKAIEAATTAENAKNTVVDTANQVSAYKEIVLNAKSDILIAKQDTITAKNEAVAAKNDAITAKDTAVEQANSASLNKDKTDTNVTTTKQLAEQVGTDKTEVSEMVTESRAILEEQRKLIDSMPPIYDDSELKSRMTTAEGEISTLKEDIGNIKKKKNVVVYVGSAELSAEQKLSCDYVCDGVDDQIEINQAISSLPDSGGEIHLSRGIFNVSNTIHIRKRIKLVGEGKGITLDRNNVNNGGTTLLSELTGGCVIQIEQSDTLSDIKGITLSDFQIVGAGINVENNYSNGINVTTYIDCVTLERLAICHCFYGLFVDQSATVDDISVTNCDFQRDSTGIYIYGQGWQTRIENNIFWDMSGRQETSGILLSAGKNIVNGNYFGVSSLIYQGMACAWISAKNAVFLLCNGNSFSSCTSSPIRFEAGGQFANISGNSFYEIGKAQFNHNERAVLYVDGAGTGGGRITFTNNTVFWANDDDWKTSYLAYLTNRVAQVNISNNTVIDGIGKINEDELVYKSEDSAYAITIGNNVLC